MPAFAKTLVSHEVMWIGPFLTGRRSQVQVLHRSFTDDIERELQWRGIPDRDPRLTRLTRSCDNNR